MSRSTLDICCVPSCSYKINDDGTLFKFPNPQKEPEKYQRWVSKTCSNLLNLKRKTVYSHYRLCYLHYCTMRSTDDPYSEDWIKQSDSWVFEDVPQNKNESELIETSIISQASPKRKKNKIKEEISPSQDVIEDLTETKDSLFIDNTINTQKYPRTKKQSKKCKEDSLIILSDSNFTFHESSIENVDINDLDSISTEAKDTPKSQKQKPNSAIKCERKLHALNELSDSSISTIIIDRSQNSKHRNTNNSNDLASKSKKSKDDKKGEKQKPESAIQNEKKMHALDEISDSSLLSILIDSSQNSKNININNLNNFESKSKKAKDATKGKKKNLELAITNERKLDDLDEVSDPSILTNKKCIDQNSKNENISHYLDSVNLKNKDNFESKKQIQDSVKIDKSNIVLEELSDSSTSTIVLDCGQKSPTIKLPLNDAFNKIPNRVTSKVKTAKKKNKKSVKQPSEIQLKLTRYFSIKNFDSESDDDDSDNVSDYNASKPLPISKKIFSDLSSSDSEFKRKKINEIIHSLDRNTNNKIINQKNISGKTKPSAQNINEHNNNHKCTSDTDSSLDLNVKKIRRSIRNAAIDKIFSLSTDIPIDTYDSSEDEINIEKREYVPKNEKASPIEDCIDIFSIPDVNSNIDINISFDNIKDEDYLEKEALKWLTSQNSEVTDSKKLTIVEAVIHNEPSKTHNKENLEINSDNFNAPEIVNENNIVNRSFMPLDDMIQENNIADEATSTKNSELIQEKKSKDLCQTEIIFNAMDKGLSFRRKPLERQENIQNDKTLNDITLNDKEKKINHSTNKNIKDKKLDLANKESIEKLLDKTLKSNKKTRTRRKKCKITNNKITKKHIESVVNDIVSTEAVLENKELKVVEGITTDFLRKLENLLNEERKIKNLAPLTLNISTCPICEVEVHPNDLITHVRAHNGATLYSCGLCNHTSLKAFHVRRHYWNVHDNFILCPVCSHCVDEADELKTHIKEVHPQSTNQPEQKYKSVDSVTKLFGSAGYKYETFNKNFKCPICKKLIDIISILSHMLYHSTHKSLPCAKCDFAFCTKLELSLHQRHVHGNKNNLQSTLSNKKCTLCNFKYRTKNELVKHMVKHKSKEMKCPHCPQVLIDQYMLEEHLKCHVKVYSCKLCDYKTTTNTNFKLHTEKHSDVSYTCQICLKVYKSRFYFTHMKKHQVQTKMPKYTCIVCSKPYIKRTAYMAHLKKKHKRNTALKELLRVQAEDEETKTWNINGVNYKYGEIVKYGDEGRPHFLVEVMSGNEPIAALMPAYLSDEETDFDETVLSDKREKTPKRLCKKSPKHRMDFSDDTSFSSADEMFYGNIKK